MIKTKQSNDIHTHTHKHSIVTLYARTNCLSGDFCFAIMCFLPLLPCLNGDGVECCVRACACMWKWARERVWECVPFQSPHLDAHKKKRLSWKSPAVDVIVLWLFPYLGRFNILFCCVACQQLWPRYLPFPVIQECSGPFKPKHSLCLYHQPRETLRLLIHSRIILK